MYQHYQDDLQDGIVKLKKNVFKNDKSICFEFTHSLLSTEGH